MVGRVFGVWEIMILGNFNNCALLGLLFYNNVTLYWSAYGPSAPRLHSGHRAGLAKKQLLLFEWCLPYNWATLLPVISGRGWVGECEEKCETWISIVFWTLSSNLFVCTPRWQPADPSRINARMVSSAILSLLTEGTMDGPSFVWAGGVGPYPSDAPGLIIRTQTCTYTNTRWISPQKVALSDNSSFGEYLVTMATHTVAWPRGSMGNEWSPSAGGCVCLFCSGQISMSRVRVCHMEAACDRAELLAGVSALKGEKEQKQM